MKFRLLLSLVFIIVTSFIPAHEVKHFVDGDNAPCLVCHVNDNLTSADAINDISYVTIFHFEKISKNSSILYYHNHKTSDQNRAPPKIS